MASLDSDAWRTIQILASKHPSFEKIPTSIETNAKEWENWFNSATPLHNEILQNNNI